MLATAPLFTKLIECPKKIVVCQGGGDAAKTVSILQALAVDIIKDPGSINTITGQDRPNLVGGALRSFQRYVLCDPDIQSQVKKFNESSLIYTFQNEAIIEFKAFDDEQDARGSERDRLFMNECNSQSYQMFWQLQRKTRKKVYLDYNPTSAFWVHEKILSGEEKQFNGQYQLYITDHRHNPFLTKEEHEAYEKISDPDMFLVYSRGKTGLIKGKIFGHFKKCSLQEIPNHKNGTRLDDGTIVKNGYDRIIYGIDYGYTNDPTAIVKIWIRGSGIFKTIWVQELSYEPGLSAERIKDILIGKGYKSGEVIYSEADPNMVNQLRAIGLPVMSAIKGPGSVAAGISKVKGLTCYYTDDSHNFEKEKDNYKFVTSQDLITGKEVLTNIPVDAFNHLCDATRYAVYTDSFRSR